MSVPHTIFITPVLYGFYIREYQVTALPLQDIVWSFEILCVFADQISHFCKNRSLWFWVDYSEAVDHFRFSYHLQNKFFIVH